MWTGLEWAVESEEVILDKLYCELLKISANTETTPKLNIIPMYGGRWVTTLKIGTKTIALRPNINILELYLSLSVVDLLSSISPLNWGKKEAITVGTTIHTIEGINRYEINSGVVTLSPIQSIVVVTSPIGDHAPPALAAIIISPAYHSRMFLSETTFCKMDISTIVAVRLSIIAESINARPQKIHSIVFFFL